MRGSFLRWSCTDFLSSAWQTMHKCFLVVWLQHLLLLSSMKVLPENSLSSLSRCYRRYDKVYSSKRLFPLASIQVVLTLKNLAMCNACNHFNGRNLWVYHYLCMCTFYKGPGCVLANESSLSKFVPTHRTEWSQWCIWWRLEAMKKTQIPVQPPNSNRFPLPSNLELTFNTE